MAVSNFNSKQPSLSVSSNSNLTIKPMQSPSHTQRLLSILLSLMDILNQAGKALTDEPENESSENTFKDSNTADENLSFKTSKTKARSLTNDFQDMTKLLRVIELKSQLRKDISRISTLDDTKSELDPKEIKNMYQLLRNILRDVAANEESVAFQNLYSQGKKLASEAVLFSKPPLSPTAIESSASYDSYSCDSGSEPEFEHFSELNSSRSFDNKTKLCSSSCSFGQKNFSSCGINSSLSQVSQLQINNNLLKNTLVNGKERPRLSNSSFMYSSPNLNRELSTTSLSEDFECLDLQERPATFRDAQGFDNRIAKGQFALSVLVGDPYKVGTGYRSFTVYSCQARGADGKFYDIRKRYSDFGRLRDNLLRLYPQFKKHIPRMPNKKVVGKFEADFVEKRRQGLEYFLSYVSLHPIIGCSPLIVRFFTRP